MFQSVIHLCNLFLKISSKCTKLLHLFWGESGENVFDYLFIIYLIQSWNSGIEFN